MADLLAISVGNLFLGAIMPGLLLSALYFLYILVVSSLKPHWAPSLSDDVGPDDALGMILMLLKGFLPPVFLITLRSEEHTSELQSLMRISYAVFCLKKKKTLHTQHQ